MNRKRWTVAGMLALTMAVAGIAAAEETAAADGATLEAAGLPASVAHALKLERHHHYSHRHHHAAGGIKR